MSTATQQAYVPRRSPVLDSNLITRDWDVWFQNIATNLAALNTDVSAWFDVKTEGAVEIAGVDNRAAIQRTIDHAADAGGGIVLISGGFDYDGDLTVTANNVTLLGLGRDRSYLRQLTGGSDGLVCGVDSIFLQNFCLRDLTLDGHSLGAKLLRMNNCLWSVVERVNFKDADYGLYCEGSNETHSFRDLNFNNFTANGILAGVSNGITVTTGEGDFPELQKCTFQRIKVSGCEDTAVVITAGVFNAAQQSSGVNRFEQMRLESNKQDGMQVSYAFMTAIDGLSNEDVPRANNVYYALVVDHSSIVSLTHADLFRGQGGNDYVAKIHVDAASLLLSDSVIGLDGVSVAGDIVVDGGALAMDNCFISGDTGIVFGSAAARNGSMLTNVFGPSGLPITTWPTTYRYLSPSSEGIEIPSPVISHAMRLQAIDTGAITSVFLDTAAGANTVTRLTLSGGTATDPCWESDGAGGWQAVKGNISGFSNIRGLQMTADAFNLTTKPDYTVTNPVTNRSIDVSAATLAQTREVLGTLIADLITAGFLQ